MQSQPSAKRKNSKRLRRWMQTKSGRRDDRNGCVKRIKIVLILKSSKMKMKKAHRASHFRSS